MEALKITNLQAAVGEQQILRGVDLIVELGKVQALMGPNGSGKSTLSSVLAGHPAYTVTGGMVQWRGQNLLELAPDARAQAGIFLAFQYPQEIPGVTLATFLRAAVNAVRAARDEDELSPLQFRRTMHAQMDVLKMDHAFGERYLNHGFSGGEKKRAEILQLSLLQPAVAILDETDSGLDIDALRIVSDGVNAIKQQRPELAVLLITHYQRILDYVKPDLVHVMLDGRIAETGGPELVDKLEREGYDWVQAAVAGT